MFILDAVTPNVYGPVSINVTFNVTTFFYIEANFTGNVTYFISANSSSYTLINNKTGQVKFDALVLNDTVLVGAVDDQTGLSGFIQPHIVYCYCLNGGACDFSGVELEIGKFQ